MTSKEELYQAFRRLTNAEGATPERIENFPTIMAAFGLNDPSLVRVELGKLLSSITDEKARRYSLNAFGFGPSDLPTADRRRKHLASKNTSIKFENEAIRILVDMLMQHDDLIGHDGASLYDRDETPREPIRDKDEVNDEAPQVASNRSRAEEKNSTLARFTFSKKISGLYAHSVKSVKNNRVWLFWRPHLWLVISLLFISGSWFFLGTLWSGRSDGAGVGAQTSAANPARSLTYEEFSKLSEVEQLDACITEIRTKYISTWNRWIQEGLRPTVGKPAYPDEENPTANGLLNLTSVVLKIIEEEPNVDVAQNLVTCAYDPGSPQYFESVSLIASGKLLAPKPESTDRTSIDRSV